MLDPIFARWPELVAIVDRHPIVAEVLAAFLLDFRDPLHRAAARVGRLPGDGPFAALMADEILRLRASCGPGRDMLTSAAGVPTGPHATPLTALALAARRYHREKDVVAVDAVARAHHRRGVAIVRRALETAAQEYARSVGGLE